MFWKLKTLAEMSDEEWESLCDGCGRCCVWKFEDEDSGEILYTDIRCELFDDSSCRCTDYQRRRARVPDCMDIRTMDDAHYAWLPSTCAYRLLHAGQPLPDWHPLLSGDAESPHRAGISLRGRTVCGDGFTPPDILRHIIDPDIDPDDAPAGADDG